MADSSASFPEMTPSEPHVPVDKPPRPRGYHDEPFDHTQFMRRRAMTGAELRTREARVFAEAALEEAAAAQNHTGVMVALFPDPKVAAKLAQVGGEPKGELHVTLAFLGRTDDLKDSDKLTDIVKGWAASTPTLAGTVSGYGLFTEGPKPVRYASVDLPELPQARERLIDALRSGGFPPATDHGFTPHMTLRYDDKDVELPKTKLSFDEVTLAIGDDRETIKLTGSSD